MGTQFKYTKATLDSTETTESDLGNILKPDRASRITGIRAAVALETGTSGDGCLGTARLKFSGCGELDGIPVDIVCQEDLGVHPYSVEKYLGCNIDVSRLNTGAIIDCFMTLTVAQGGTCVGAVYLRFE